MSQAQLNVRLQAFSDILGSLSASVAFHFGVFTPLSGFQQMYTVSFTTLKTFENFENLTNLKNSGVS